MTAVWDWLTIDLIAFLGDVWNWIAEHAIDMFFLVTIGSLLLMGAFALFGQPSWRSQQIDLCVRSFEYTHDQCEFIVNNHVNPGTPPLHGVH